MEKELPGAACGGLSGRLVWHMEWSRYLQLRAVKTSRPDDVRRAIAKRSQPTGWVRAQLDRLSGHEYASPRLAALQRREIAGSRVSGKRYQFSAPCSVGRI